MFFYDILSYKGVSTDTSMLCSQLQDWPKKFALHYNLPFFKKMHNRLYSKTFGLRTI